MSHKVSGYMMVLNERHGLPTAIQCMLRYVDELLIMDCGSTDGTWELVNKLAESEPRIWHMQEVQEGGRYSNEWEEPRRRNWLIERCEHDWILTLDGDETLDDLPDEFFRNATAPLYFATINAASRTHYIVRRKEGNVWRNWYPDWHVRFFPKTFRYNNTPLHCYIRNPDGESAMTCSNPSNAHLWHWNALLQDERMNCLRDHPEEWEIMPHFVPLPSLVPSRSV